MTPTIVLCDCLWAQAPQPLHQPLYVYCMLLFASPFDCVSGLAYVRTGTILVKVSTRASSKKTLRVGRRSRRFGRDIPTFCTRVLLAPVSPLTNGALKHICALRNPKLPAIKHKQDTFLNGSTGAHKTHVQHLRTHV